MPKFGLEERQIAKNALEWVIYRPDTRNAIHPNDLNWISQRAPQLNGQIVVLTGAGPESFCSGFDRNALFTATASPEQLPDKSLIEATNAILRANATFIAVLRGYAIGAGVELACCCDIRIAIPEVYFLIPAGKLGIIYHPHGVKRLHSVFGPSLGRRLFLLGEPVTATEAWNAGAIDKIVPKLELDTTVEQLIHQLSTLESANLRAHRDLFRLLDAQQTPPDSFFSHYEQERADSFQRLISRSIADKSPR